MLRRLLLSLLVLCLAVPAVAMPLGHGQQPQGQQPQGQQPQGQQPQPTASHCAPDHGAHHSPRQAPASPQHDCIGCIAPLTALPVVERGPLPRAALALPGTSAALPGTTLRPDLPPPRA